MTPHKKSEQDEHDRYIGEAVLQDHVIQEALEDYRTGNAELIPHEEVMERLEARIREATMRYAHNAG